MNQRQLQPELNPNFPSCLIREVKSLVTLYLWLKALLASWRGNLTSVLRQGKQQTPAVHKSNIVFTQNTMIQPIVHAWWAGSDGYNMHKELIAYQSG